MQIRIAHQLLRAHPATRCHHQHLLNKGTSFQRYTLFLRKVRLVRKRNQASGYGLVQILGFLPLKRKATVEHRVKQYACGPDVSGRPRVLPPLHDLGRHVRRRPAKHLELGVGVRAAAETEINKLDLLLLVDDNVLQLDVPVGHIPFMQVLQSS